MIEFTFILRLTGDCYLDLHDNVKHNYWIKYRRVTYIYSARILTV